MPFIQLIVYLIILGVIVWAMNYLLAGYIEPWILALINKLVVVLVVIMILFFKSMAVSFGSFAKSRAATPAT